jgi:hypothetical protein
LAALAARGATVFVFATSDDKGALTAAVAVLHGKVIAVVE